jgi:DNA-binding transcriptional LysR family regulator
VLITPKSSPNIRTPKDIGNLTVIAFANGCSYRRRLEAWLGTANIHPDRVMEFQSYHAIIACVAAGAGVAVVPRSVISMTSAACDVNLVRLPAQSSKARTQLVWRPNHHSVALEALKRLIPSTSTRKKAP